MTRSSIVMVAWKMPTFFNVWRLTAVHSYSTKMLESGTTKSKKNRSLCVQLRLRVKTVASQFFQSTSLAKQMESLWLGHVAGDAVTEINGNSVLGMTQIQTAACLVSSDSVMLS
jgi:hypothetical protein